jgi:ABC-type molybdate transport system substrate-binding protein
LLVAGNAFAAQTNVAVAANFTEAAKEIAAAFQQKTGHEAVLSLDRAGSSTRRSCSARRFGCAAATRKST